MIPLPLRLISVAEFQAKPEPTGEFGWELHAGEIVPVTRPKNRHLWLQVRLMALLGEQAPSGSFVSMEMPFCAYPEYDMRVADVGYISRERWAQTDPDGNLQGAPDITIEILSPSNTAREMREKCDKISMSNPAFRNYSVQALACSLVGGYRSSTKRPPLHVCLQVMRWVQQQKIDKSAKLEFVRCLIQY